MTRSSAQLVFCLTLFIPWLIGCTLIKPDWTWPGKPKATIPQSVVPIWTDTVLYQPGEPGVRGFGGRIYFYNEGKTDPIPVDGSLTVYVFDGDQNDVNHTKPLRKFVFTADQLKNHYSSSELGDSYSVWIPWDKVGGPSLSLSMITRFDGRNGGTAISDIANKLLPGATNSIDLQMAEVPDEAVLRQVSHTEPVMNDLESDQHHSDPRVDTYSLTLPTSFQRHLRSESAEPQLNVFKAQDQTAISQINSRAKNRKDDPVAEEGLELEALAPESHSQPPRFPARRESRSRPASSRIRTQPIPGAWPSALAPTPRSANSRPAARPAVPSQ